MTNTKKQLKINKLFRARGVTRTPEDCDDIQEEIQQLQEKLKEKQDELFQLQRNKYKRKLSPPIKKTDVFVRPQKIILNNSVETLKNKLELMGMLTGVEVKSFVMNDHCSIVYHMQNDTEFDVKDGLRIEMETVSGDREISNSTLPLGFNLKAAMDGFENVMMPECLGTIRRALVAYYDRLGQCEKLKKLLNIDGQLIKTLDGSHIEISFYAQSETEMENDNVINVTLIFDYRVCDIRPKVYSFKEEDLADGVSDILKQQCILFKKKPLHKAFKEAFITGVGIYKVFHQAGEEPERAAPQRRPRGARPRHHDDTFLPEQCSDQGDDDEHMD